MKLSTFAARVFLASVCLSARAGNPITVDFSGFSAPALQAYQCNVKSFDVTLRNSGAAVNLTNQTPFLWWATNATASAVSLATCTVWSITGGTFSATFTASGLNYAAGNYVYGVGVSSNGITTARIGALTIMADPYASGAGPVPWWPATLDWTRYGYTNTLTSGPCIFGAGLTATEDAAGRVHVAATSTGSDPVLSNMIVAASNALHSADTNEAAVRADADSQAVLTNGTRAIYSGGVRVLQFGTNGFATPRDVGIAFRFDGSDMLVHVRDFLVFDSGSIMDASSNMSIAPTSRELLGNWGPGLAAAGAVTGAPWLAAGYLTNEELWVAASGTLYSGLASLATNVDARLSAADLSTHSDQPWNVGHAAPTNEVSMNSFGIDGASYYGCRNTGDGMGMVAWDTNRAAMWVGDINNEFDVVYWFSRGGIELAMGHFAGNGSGLTNIPESGIVGLTNDLHALTTNVAARAPTNSPTFRDSLTLTNGYGKGASISVSQDGFLEVRAYGDTNAAPGLLFDGSVAAFGGDLSAAGVISGNAAGLTNIPESGIVGLTNDLHALTTNVTGLANTLAALSNSIPSTTGFVQRASLCPFDLISTNGMVMAHPRYDATAFWERYNQAVRWWYYNTFLASPLLTLQTVQPPYYTPYGWEHFVIDSEGVWGEGSGFSLNGVPGVSNWDDNMSEITNAICFSGCEFVTPARSGKVLFIFDDIDFDQAWTDRVDITYDNWETTSQRLDLVRWDIVRLQGSSPSFGLVNPKIYGGYYTVPANVTADCVNVRWEMNGPDLKVTRGLWIIGTP